MNSALTGQGAAQIRWDSRQEEGWREGWRVKRREEDCSWSWIMKCNVISLQTKGSSFHCTWHFARRPASASVLPDIYYLQSLEKGAGVSSHTRERIHCSLLSMKVSIVQEVFNLLIPPHLSSFVTHFLSWSLCSHSFIQQVLFVPSNLIMFVYLQLLEFKDVKANNQKSFAVTC